MLYFQLYSFPCLSLSYTFYGYQVRVYQVPNDNKLTLPLTWNKSQRDSSHWHILSQVYSKEWPWPNTRMATGSNIAVHCLTCWVRRGRIWDPGRLTKGNVLPKFRFCEIQSNVILTRFNITRYFIHHSLTKAEYKSECQITNYIPYLALTSELWGVFCVWGLCRKPHYNGTAP